MRSPPRVLHAVESGGNEAAAWMIDSNCSEQSAPCRRKGSVEELQNGTRESFWVEILLSQTYFVVLIINEAAGKELRPRD